MDESGLSYLEVRIKMYWLLKFGNDGKGGVMKWVPGLLLGEIVVIHKMIESGRAVKGYSNS